jgi:hypothetical protein
MLSNKPIEAPRTSVPVPHTPVTMPTTLPSQSSMDHEFMQWIRESSESPSLPSPLHRYRLDSPVPDTDASFGSFLDTPLFEEPGLFETPALQDSDSFDVEDTPLMATPSLEPEHLYTFGSPDIFSSPAIVDIHSFESMSGVGLEDVPLMGPPIDYYKDELAAVVEAPHPKDTSRAESVDPKTDKKWTGTRPNITPSTLIPLDAPVQKRQYMTPSATSRKEIPAAFVTRGKKRGIEEVEAAVDPSLARQIEIKRFQNTQAARRSRARKLEYQRQLEDEIAALRQENETLRQRNAELEHAHNGR